MFQSQKKKRKEIFLVELWYALGPLSLSFVCVCSFLTQKKKKKGRKEHNFFN